MKNKNKEKRKPSKLAHCMFDCVSKQVLDEYLVFYLVFQTSIISGFNKDIMTIAQVIRLFQNKNEKRMKLIFHLGIRG